MNGSVMSASFQSVKSVFLALVVVLVASVGVFIASAGPAGAAPVSACDVKGYEIKDVQGKWVYSRGSINCGNMSTSGTLATQIQTRVQVLIPITSGPIKSVGGNSAWLSAQSNNFNCNGTGSRTYLSWAKGYDNKGGEKATTGPVKVVNC